MGARQHEGVPVQPLRKLILLAALACAGRLPADLPSARLHVVFPPGGKAGTTFDVAVSGADLDGASALLFSHPGITAVPKLEPAGLPGLDPEPIQGRFTVTIAPDAPAGVHEARLSGRHGLSNPRAFAVGSLSEALEAEPNDRIDQALAAPAVALETTLSGAAGGGADVDFFKVNARAGQRIIIDCWAERIDSRLDAVLVLLDAAGREIDRSHDAVARDPLIDFTAPADGDYAIKVHDFLYAGSPEHFYRLLVSAAPRVDSIFPAAALPGTKGKFSIYGRNLPGGEPAKGLELGGTTLERVEVEIELPGEEAAQAIAPGAWPIDLRGAFLDGAAVRLPPERGIPEPLLLYFARAPVVLEAEPNDGPAAAQKVSVPAEVAGRFHPADDRDWFAFDAAGGDVFWIEVFAERLGRAADPYLLVQQVVKNEKGEEQVKDLQGIDDLGGDVGGPGYGAATSDPAYRFVAPATGTYRVMVHDLASGSSDPRSVYRLEIRRESPDFRLVAVPRPAGASRDEPAVGSALLRRGGTETIDVLAFRRDGFGGAIDVAVEGLPSWVSCAGATIGPGRTAATLVLRAAGDAPDWRGRIRVSGRARTGEADMVRAARFGSVTWPGPRAQTGAAPRLTRDLGLAVTSDEAPFLVEPARSASVLEMSRAGTLEVPVALTRRGDFKGKVALAAVDLPPNVEAEALTLEENATAGTLKLKVKRDAPAGTFTMHLRAAAQVSHRRDPEGARALAARKAEVEKAATDVAAAAKVAAESKAAADRGAEEAAQADQKAVDALAAAPAEGKAAAEAVKAAAGEVRKLADAMKAALDRTSAEAEARAKAAADLLARAVKRAEDAAKASSPANVDVALASTPFTIRITEAPVAIEVASPLGVKQGAKLEVPVAIARLHGFSEPVQVSLVLPGGSPGVVAREAAIAAGETRGTIVVEAAADAAPGRRTVSVRAALKWNGQDLQTAREVTLVVEEMK